MIITKIITYAIDIHDVIGFYTDPEGNVRSILEHRLRGRCYQACFITEITKILSIGDCIITQDGAPTHGVLSITFEVRAVELTPGEIINGCKMISREPNGTVLCETESAKIMIFDAVPMASVTPGQIVSVRVLSRQSNVGAPNISVLGDPLMPIRKPKVYRCTPLTPQQLATVAPALEDALAEVIRCAPLRAKTEWKFFDEMLYAWVKPQSAPADAVTLDLQAIASGAIEAPAYLSRDNRARLADPTVYGYATAPDTPAEIDKSIDSAGVVVALLADWVSYMRTVREHVEIYSTPELMRAHQNVWRMYVKQKL